MSQITSACMGLGVGMDLPWGAPVGFDPATNAPTEKVANFLTKHIDDYSYCSFSFQPKGTIPLEVTHYALPYKTLVRNLPPRIPVVLHQTLLNLGSVEDYDRTSIVDFTNELHEELTWKWIVEDLGMWSINGIPMPYPLPPYLVEENIGNVARNIRDTARNLAAQLHVEFPGFTDGVSVVIGDIDAYDFFCRVVDLADVPVTLDVGHLLSWRWWQGYRGVELYEGLERLPLDRCKELHLAGAAVSRGRFLDLHHGVLMQEQLDLCEILLERCTNLEGVTYEDPNYDRQGTLVSSSIECLDQLRSMVSQWQASI